MPKMHNYQDLIYLFNHCFANDYNTRLVKGESEPIYLPASKECPYHSVVFAHGFFSSALHECAHWFIAGEKRRLLIDYGYWYIPDGRNKEQQALFQQVEVKPQAIEWLLSKAAKHPFHFSIDNLEGEVGDTKAFKSAVTQQVLWYEQHGLPKRASLFYNVLQVFYR